MSAYNTSGGVPMSIDFREIELTEDQKRRVAELAEESGKSWSTVIDEQLEIPIDSAGAKRFVAFQDKYIRDPKKRLAYFREWVARRKSYNPNFDDSRESIYPDRG
jgi:hypothetical protein